MKDLIKKSFTSALIFSATVICVGITYAAISTVETGTTLNKDMWNELVTNINNLNTTVSGLTTSIARINTNLSQITNNGTNNIKVNIGSSSETADLTVSTQTWTAIPGVSNTFNLAYGKTVKMNAYGSVTTTLGRANTYAHCGFRFVIDGIPYGQATWGDQIIGCADSSKSVGYWCPWSIERELNLGAGSHTISVQMVSQGATYEACATNTQDYSKARMFIEAR
ncbi:MAG: hypothetical protein PHG82_01165 [Candidatus Gracilibacteria bacterium]|nr:hypothetical protein [Candidatus Gracilibacteria bacterium]